MMSLQEGRQVREPQNPVGVVLTRLPLDSHRLSLRHLSLNWLRGSPLVETHYTGLRGWVTEIVIAITFCWTLVMGLCEMG